MTSSDCRRQDLFPTASDDVYGSLYQFVLSTPALRFPDFHSLLKTTKQEGKVMSVVISHVGQWLNREPTRVGERDNNKPPLRNDFLPALRKKSGEDADKLSIKLQEQLLRYVRDNISDFTRPAVEHYLREYPGNNNKDAYAKRFEHQAWRDVLVLVVELAGPHLQHECLVRFNTEDPREIGSIPTSAIAQAVCKSITHIPEVAHNPALRKESAVDDLWKRIQPVIVEWAAKQCSEALEGHDEQWQPSTLQLLETERAKYSALLEEMRPSSPSVPSPPVFRSVVLGEPQGGDDVAVCDSRSDTHGSDREHTTTQSSNNGVTASPCTARDPQPSLALDPTGLALGDMQNLRKLHRSRKRQPLSGCRTSRASAQELDGERVVEKSGSLNRHKGPKQQPLVKSSGHWRQRAVAKAGNG